MEVAFNLNKTHVNIQICSETWEVDFMAAGETWKVRMRKGRSITLF